MYCKVDPKLAQLGAGPTTFGQMLAGNNQIWAEFEPSSAEVDKIIPKSAKVGRSRLKSGRNSTNLPQKWQQMGRRAEVSAEVCLDICEFAPKLWQVGADSTVFSLSSTTSPKYRRSPNMRFWASRGGGTNILRDAY